MAINAIVLSLVKEIKDFSTVGSSKTCSNRRDKKDKYSDSIPKLANRVCFSVRLIYHRSRS